VKRAYAETTPLSPSTYAWVGLGRWVYNYIL